MGQLIINANAAVGLITGKILAANNYHLNVRYIFVIIARLMGGM